MTIVDDLVASPGLYTGVDRVAGTARDLAVLELTTP